MRPTGQPRRDDVSRVAPARALENGAGRCHPWPTDAEQNIALIRRGLDAFSHGDFEAVRHIMWPDVEWHLAFRLPDLPPGKDVYRGPDEVIGLWRAFGSVWETLTVTIEEIIEAHEHVVVLRARFAGRGSRSGTDVDRVIFYVFDVSDGKLLRLRPFDSEAEAVAAAGLRQAAG